MARSTGGWVVDLAPFQAFLHVMDRNVSRDTRETLKASAHRIALDARYNAPVLKYNLENAIKVQPVVANQWHMRLTIKVGGMVGGVNVSEYAAMVHEMSWDRRGPLTRAKGPQAGPRYLTRAMELNRKETIGKLSEATEKAIKNAARTTGVSRRRK